jgi:hypothetical protein
MRHNEGVEKLKDISTLSFWLYFRLKIAPYFKYKSVKSTQNYSRPLSVYYIFLNSIFLQPERRHNLLAGAQRKAVELMALLNDFLTD